AQRWQAERGRATDGKHRTSTDDQAQDSRSGRAVPGNRPKLTAEIFEKLVELRKQGISMLIVEQNAAQALEVAGYAYVLQEGRVINEGPPSHLMDSEELRKAYFSIE